MSETLAPIGAGLVIGAVAGGLLVGLVPGVALLKLTLGMIPVVSAVRIFRK